MDGWIDRLTDIKLNGELRNLYSLLFPSHCYADFTWRYEVLRCGKCRL